MFRRKEFSNELTEELDQNPDMSVIDLLKHPLMPAVVTAQARKFLDYLQRPDKSGRPHMYDLIDMALSKKYEKNCKQYRKWQLHHNAANIFASHGQEISALVCGDKDQYLFKKLKAFHTSQVSKDPVFAGHFQRIFESVATKDETWVDSDYLKQLIPFLCENIEITAYQGLLVHLAVEFSHILENIPEYKSQPTSTLVIEILKWAASCVFCVKETETKDLALMYKKRDKALKERTDDQPRATDGKVVPKPVFPKPGKPVKKKQLKKGELEKKATKSKPKPKPGRDYSLNAYLLLSTLRMMIDESGDMERIFAPEKEREIFEWLFCCGVYADSYSLVAHKAFEILKIIAYGIDNDEFSMEPVPSKTWKEVAEEFAEEMTFSGVLTPKMVAAFPFFANHRYAELDDGFDYPVLQGKYLTPARTQESEKSPKVTSTREWVYKKPKGKTPLEFYAPLLLEEPQLSDQMSNSVLMMLQLLINEANKIREEAKGEEWECYQERVHEADWRVIEVFRTQFIREGKKTTLFEAMFCPSWVPLMPRDRSNRESQGARERQRAPVNGFGLELCNLYLTSHVGTLFEGTWKRIWMFMPNATKESDLMIIQAKLNLEFLAKFNERAQLTSKGMPQVLEGLAKREGESDE